MTTVTVHYCSGRDKKNGLYIIKYEPDTRHSLINSTLCYAVLKFDMCGPASEALINKLVLNDYHQI